MPLIRRFLHKVTSVEQTHVLPAKPVNDFFSIQLLFAFLLFLNAVLVNTVPGKIT